MSEDILKVAERTLYRLAQERTIPAFKVGASWRFKHPDLDVRIETQKASEIDRALVGQEY